MIQRVVISIFFIIAINFSVFGLEKNDIKYINDYIRNIENISPAKLDCITNITFKCYYYYMSKLKELEPTIIKSAKNNRNVRMQIIPSKEFSVCPKVIVNVSSEFLSPEGIFNKGIVYLNYNPYSMCENKKVLNVFDKRMCKKPNFSLTLMHELIHFAFFKIYGNLKFRNVIFEEYERCKDENCKDLELLNKLISYRNFFDEFPAILFSNIWEKIKLCKVLNIDELNNYQLFVKFTMSLSERDFLSCRLEGDCGVYYLYRQLKDVAGDFKICIPKEKAFKILIKEVVKEERKKFVPLLKSYIKKKIKVN